MVSVTVRWGPIYSARTGVTLTNEIRITMKYVNFLRLICIRLAGFRML